MRRLSKLSSLLVSLVVLAIMIGLRIADPAVMQQLRWLTFDTYQRIAPRPYDPESPVKIIDIDDESLARIGQWPWPRIVLAQMVRNLTEAGAAAIAFDIVFGEPDRSSPEQALKYWPQSEETLALQKRVSALPSHDELFAEALQEAPFIAGFVLTHGQKGKLRPDSKSTFAIAGDDPRDFVLDYDNAVTNLPVIEEAALGNGALNSTPEGDLVIRRVPLLFELDGEFYPSLAAESLRVVQGAKTYLIKSSGASATTAYGEHTGIDAIGIGQFQVRTDGGGRVFLHFSHSVPDRYVPAWRILEGAFDPNDVAGRIVFVGTSAAGLLDLRATPLQRAMPGVEIHVQVIEQILTGEFLERPSFAAGAEVIYLLVLGLLLIVLLRLIGALASLLTGGAAAAVVVGGSWYAFVNQGWLVDAIIPSLMVFVVFLTGTVVSYLGSEAQRRFVRDAFSRYLSPVVVERLAKNPDQLKLGGERKPMTVLFSDIRGFTGISERFKEDPEGLTNLINRFLTPMTEVILARNGTIDKYMGDALMAFWNAPLDDEAHASNACRAALQMQESLRALNAELRSLDGQGHSSSAQGMQEAARERARSAVGRTNGEDLGARGAGADNSLGTLIASAEDGSSSAQYRLGKAYRDGHGVEQDHAHAARWFAAAAAQGYSKAQRHLGTCYATGRGVEQDTVSAMMWFMLAAQQGLVTAEYSLAELLKSASPEERNEAERQARMWAPDTQSARQIQLDIGIGISTGQCLVGNLGSTYRFDYSVLGDPVNLASRLEGQTKSYGVRIILSEATQVLAPEFACLEIDYIAVKGKQEAVKIYALLGSPELAASSEFRDLREKHELMLAAYREQRWASARELMEACTEIDPGLSKLYDMYRDRIGRFEREPPGRNWDGVYTALSK